MTDKPISGRKLLEAAKRVRARRLQEAGNGTEAARLPSDAELLAMIEAEALERKEAHRERMRRYYRERHPVHPAQPEEPLPELLQAKPNRQGRSRTRV